MPPFDTDTSVANVSAYFDAYGGAEWDRLAADPAGRVSFELHRRMLGRHIRPGFRVLEIGPGPGRFSLELARLGATIIAADISPIRDARSPGRQQPHSVRGTVTAEVTPVRDAASRIPPVRSVVWRHGRPD